MTAVQSIATQVAARFGGDLTRMRRANGYSNATWVGEGIAVRVTHTPADMGGEAALVRALPPEVGHPEILAEGTADGHGWMVTREVRGENLHDVWPTLNTAERSRAVRQLWDRVRPVHEATSTLTMHVAAHGGFVPASLDDVTATVERAGSAGALTDARRSRLNDIIERYSLAAAETRRVVNHGDLALMNALWKGEVVSLLDFEYAVLGPVEIDLCRLIVEASVTDDGECLESAAADAAVEIVAAQMDPNHGRALLHGAAALDQLRDLKIWLDGEIDDRPLQDWRPCRLLRGLLDADGGYLAPLLA